MEEEIQKAPPAKKKNKVVILILVIAIVVLVILMIIKSIMNVLFQGILAQNNYGFFLTGDSNGKYQNLIMPKPSPCNEQLIIVSNHPLGALEALAIAKHLGQKFGNEHINLITNDILTLK